MQRTLPALAFFRPRVGVVGEKVTESFSLFGDLSLARGSGEAIPVEGSSHAWGISHVRSTLAVVHCRQLNKVCPVSDCCGFCRFDNDMRKTAKQSAKSAAFGSLFLFASRLRCTGYALQQGKR